MFNWPCRWCHQSKPASCTSVLSSHRTTLGLWPAAILHCQAPNPLSVLLHKATGSLLDPCKGVTAGIWPPRTCQILWAAVCLMPAAAPLARCFTFPVPITCVNMNNLGHHSQTRMSHSYHEQPLLISFTWAAALADFGEGLRDLGDEQRSLQWSTAARAGCVLKTSSILLSTPSVQLMK